MKGLVLSIGAAVGLLGFTGTASAQWHHGHHHGHHHHHHGFYPGYGWGGGHYHYIPARSVYHPDPWGGHVHYRPGGLIYHNGPDYFPAYRSFGGYPGYGYRYGGYGYPGYGYRPGFSFGLTIIR
jgi:hypothetical protein